TLGIHVNAFYRIALQAVRIKRHMLKITELVVRNSLSRVQQLTKTIIGTYPYRAFQVFCYGFDFVVVKRMRCGRSTVVDITIFLRQVQVESVVKSSYPKPFLRIHEQLDDLIGSG